MLKKLRQWLQPTEAEMKAALDLFMFRGPITSPDQAVRLGGLPPILPASPETRNDN